MPELNEGQGFESTSKWQGILQEVEEAQREAASNGEVIWYRGQAVADWLVRSSLHRHVIDIFESTGIHFAEGNQAFLRDEYKTIYRKFKAHAWHLLDPIERNDWGIIFKMQHYGFPTRLLDWTKSFACALFFAQWDRKREDDAVIYLLNPESLNEVSLGRRGYIALDDNSGLGNIDVRLYHPRWAAPISDLPTIAVFPFLSNPRMVAQRAAFTLSGDSFFPLDEQFEGRLRDKGYIRRIVLPADTFDEAERFLNFVGAGSYEYFPDLEGLRIAHKAETKKVLQTAKHYLATRKHSQEPSEKE